MAARASAVLVGVLMLASAVAYAATAPRRGDELSAGRFPSQGAPAPPRVTAGPAAIETATRARFRFSAVPGAVGYQCRLDSGGWRSCAPPVRYHGLGIGRHSFAVRALGRRGARGRARVVLWRVLESKAFSVALAAGGLESLYPGAAPTSLPLRLENPNPIPIVVTAITVAVSQDPVGCDSATNLDISQSSASSTQPLMIPAGGSMTVPSQGISAPTIQLLDLPFNQDACRNAKFALAFSGSAHG